MMEASLACIMAHKTPWPTLQIDWIAPYRQKRRFRRQFRIGLIEFRNRLVQTQVAKPSTGCQDEEFETALEAAQKEAIEEIK